MKDLKELQQELENNYTNKSLSIRTDGSLRLSLQIQNSKCMLTKKVLLIANSNLTDEEIEINVDDINDIEIDTEIVLEMNGNYSINIST